MSKKKRLSVGVKLDEHGNETRERFWSESAPTHESHGDIYNYVIGPFRTVAGAEFMVKYGKNNPHCRCVSEAEKLAKLEKQGKLNSQLDPVS